MFSDPASAIPTLGFKSDQFKDYQDAFERTQSIFGALGTSSPEYVIHELDGTYIIIIDVPGVKAADLNVKIVNDGKVLRISGGREVLNWHDSIATTTKKFSKNFTIGSNMDMKKVTAQLENGVLTVKAPVKEDLMVQTIPITEVASHEKVL